MPAEANRDRHNEPIAGSAMPPQWHGSLGIPARKSQAPLVTHTRAEMGMRPTRIVNLLWRDRP